MCGIVGYAGDKKAINKILTGLKSLEYRGYDSAGIAYVKDNEIKIIKKAGPIKNLEENINYNEDTNIGISHTRWATHGVANDINAHPHRQGKITLVHNGIIENYDELKKKLLKKGYIFKTGTDTEVATAVIDDIYNEEKDMIKVLNKITYIFKGSYAFNIINDDYKDVIFGIRKDSPLIAGIGNNENVLASDIPAIVHITNKYVVLDNYDVVYLTKDNVKYYDREGREIQKEIKEFSSEKETISKNGYDHFMLKEINEEPEVFKKILNKYIKDYKIVDMFDISKYEEIDIVACGSASHAGYLGKHYIEKIAGIKTTVSYASEYRYAKHFFNKKHLVIVISQSGETSDTLAALKIANENGLDTLAIVNVYKSSIAREAKYVLYTMAGIEIAVATTKAYMAQSLILLLLALNVKQDKRIIESLFRIPNLLSKYISKDYTQLAKSIYKYDDIFYLGREVDYYLALEGSLKLKEISYIHSEAYPAGELKHGTISLMDKNTLVIAIVIDDSIKDKTISNLKEVMARNTKVFAITNDNGNFSDYKIEIEEEDLLAPFVVMIPMQLIAYEVAKLRNCDIDKPRNLAKSVTVE